MSGTSTAGTPLPETGWSALIRVFLRHLCPSLRRDCYKYAIQGHDGKTVLKADPSCSAPRWPVRDRLKKLEPGGYDRRDVKDLKRRHGQNLLNRPVAIYEMHIDSWRKRRDMRSRTFADLRRVFRLSGRDGQWTGRLRLLSTSKLDDSWGIR